MTYLSPRGQGSRDAILAVLTVLPSASLSTIVAETGLALTTVRWHLGQLEDAGLVRVTDCGCCGAPVRLVR